MNHVLHGNIKFEDKVNNVTGYLNMGFVRRMPRDYFTGHIERDGLQVVNKIYGTYMGYADFDGKRYYDVRE
jgi:hypothetical protein